MRLRDINDTVTAIDEAHPELRGNKSKFKYMLSRVLDTFNNFDQTEITKSKNEKIEILKNMISDFIKDENQKEYIGDSSS